MTRLKEFLKSTLIGGLLVILPLGIMMAIVTWIFTHVHNAMIPLTKFEILEFEVSRALILIKH